jgi:methylmalonyl-CoA mutase
VKYDMASDENRLLGAFPQRTLEDWRKEVERGLSGADFEQRLVTRTLEGIAVQPLYTERDFDAAADAAGFPGAPPYLRGPVAAGRHGATWDMRPRYDNPDPRKLGDELAADLMRGARSLWLCFASEVRAGRSSAQMPRERGVPCANAAELAQLLAAVPLPEVAVSLDAGANALAVAACLFEVARRRGVALPQLDGWLNADPLGALASDGALPCSLDAAQRQMVALAAFCAQRAPRVRCATVSVVPHHEAGAHAVQELAYALATGVTYLRWLTEGGLALAEACAQLSFRFAVGADFFMEIAKLRAMRRCWSSLVRECGGGAAEQRCTIHATTSTRTKATRDPWVNMLRETSEAFSAAAGGADAITTQGFDRLLGMSDAFARRIAGNAQVILNEEAHVARVADPAGGAYYVEALSEQLAQQAWPLFQAIEARGGMAAALQSGQIAAEIAESARARGALIARRKLAITGVSEFAKVDEDRVARAEPEWDAIASARRTAATSAEEADLQSLGAAAERGLGGPELVALAIDAAGRGASLPQLSAALVGTAGVPAARIAKLPVRRDAEPFERLRDESDARERTTGRRPSVFLCNLGPIPEHQARAQFASGFFAAGGFAVLGNDGFDTPEAAAEAFAASGARLAAICGSDAAYPRWVEQLAPLLRARGALRVIVAGRAGEQEAHDRAAGVSDFIFAGCDAVATLQALLAAEGAGS